MNSLQKASLCTLSIIFSFVLFIVILIGLYTDTLSIVPAIIITIIINVILWAIGPWFSDKINRWIYKVRFFTQQEFTAEYPELSQFISSICQKYNFNFPKMGVIDDLNPTAFSYGSRRNNARIIFTSGITHYLKPDEVEAVIAHELGHVKNNDFVIMTIATTFVQILYEIYVVLAKNKKTSKSSGKKGNSLALIGLISYVLYVVSTYLLLYLSRTREYYADAFAADEIKSPNSLSQALIKVAYGIVQADDTDNSKRLLESTRAMGIMDVKNARLVGSLSYVSASPQLIAEVMTFDIVSPWAKVLELSSTHPLTGKRINRLEAMAVNKGQEKVIDFASAFSRMKIDNVRLYKNFSFEVFIYFLPGILFFVSWLGYFIWGFGGPLIAFAVGNLIKLQYRMGMSQPEPTTIMDQMRNPYASPMRGQAVALDGQVVGRGVPGFVLSEDMILQDKTGIIYLDYSSAFGFIGDMFFGFKKVRKLMGQAVQVEGWFFRGLSQMLTLRKLRHDDEVITSHPMLWGVVANVILIAVGIYLFAAYAGGTF